MSYLASTTSLTYTTHGYRSSAEPSQEELHSLFHYHQGQLLWLPRPNSRRWNTRYANTPSGSVRPDGYTMVSINGKAYRLHRLIFCYHYGYYPPIVDHIDRNPSNNCIENLRASDASLNQLNSTRPPNSTGYRCVYYDARQQLS